MYKSPIDIIYTQLETQLEDDIMRAVQSVHVNVDKEELLRALQYDRHQYKKGYADGLAYAKMELNLLREMVTEALGIVNSLSNTVSKAADRRADNG